MRVKKFLDTFESKHTVKNYRKVLRNYFRHIYPDMEDLEEAGERYFREIRNHEEDITSYFTAIKSKPPKTVQLYLSGVKSFLIENGIELKEQYWRRLRGKKRGNRAVTEDKIPSNAELKRILTHMQTNGRALILTLASSGMRIGECLQLKLNDIDLNSDPARISIRGKYTKTGNRRITFISSEAREALTEWLKVRGKYLKTAVKKSTRYEKQLDDKRVFPYESNTAYQFWLKALAKAELNERDATTKYHKLHIHVLRKFFRTRMGAVIPVDIVEALMGHEGYLTEVYRRYTEDELAGFYKRGEHALSIFTNGQEVSKLRAEVEERNKQLQILANGLSAENMELRVKMLELQNKINALEGLLNPEVKAALIEWAKTMKQKK